MTGNNTPMVAGGSTLCGGVRRRDDATETGLRTGARAHRVFSFGHLSLRSVAIDGGVAQMHAAYRAMAPIAALASRYCQRF